MANAAFIVNVQHMRAVTHGLIVSYKLTDILCLLAERRCSASFFFIDNQKKCGIDDCDVR